MLINPAITTYLRMRLLTIIPVPNSLKRSCSPVPQPLAWHQRSRGPPNTARFFVSDSRPVRSLSPRVCRKAVRRPGSGSLYKQPLQPRSRPRLPDRQFDSCLVRTLVLGCTCARRLARSFWPGLVLDASGDWQRHRSHVLCRLPRRLFSRVRNRSSSSLNRWMARRPPTPPSHSSIRWFALAPRVLRLPAIDASLAPGMVPRARYAPYRQISEKSFSLSTGCLG
jgi:hypothetical protein